MLTKTQFKIREGGFAEIRKKRLIKSIPTLLVATSGGLVITYLNPNAHEGGPNIYPFLIPFLIGLVIFSAFRGANRLKPLFDSYRLTIGDGCIVRDQYNTPQISIAIDQACAILKNADGSFTIKGDSAINAIAIPSQIEEYEKLENLLNANLCVRQLTAVMKHYLMN